MSTPSNDNALPADGLANREHGAAALLLVESLIHGLVARSGLSVTDAVDIVQVAIDVQVQISDHAGVEPSTQLLTRIADSLRADDPRAI